MSLLFKKFLVYSTVLIKLKRLLKRMSEDQKNLRFLSFSAFAKNNSKLYCTASTFSVTLKSFKIFAKNVILEQFCIIFFYYIFSISLTIF
jgi:hypothetical protein